MPEGNSGGNEGGFQGGPEAEPAIDSDPNVDADEQFDDASEEIEESGLHSELIEEDKSEQEEDTREEQAQEEHTAIDFKGPSAELVQTAKNVQASVEQRAQEITDESAQSLKTAELKTGNYTPSKEELDSQVAAFVHEVSSRAEKDNNDISSMAAAAREENTIKAEERARDLGQKVAATVKDGITGGLAENQKDQAAVQERSQGLWTGEKGFEQAMTYMEKQDKDLPSYLLGIIKAAESSFDRGSREDQHHREMMSAFIDRGQVDQFAMYLRSPEFRGAYREGMREYCLREYPDEHKALDVYNRVVNLAEKNISGIVGVLEELHTVDLGRGEKADGSLQKDTPKAETSEKTASFRERDHSALESTEAIKAITALREQDESDRNAAIRAARAIIQKAESVLEARRAEKELAQDEGIEPDAHDPPKKKKK